MILSIKNILNSYSISGDIILYRGNGHRKQEMLQYIKQHLKINNKTICVFSDGAFALWTARTFPESNVVACFSKISPDYGELMEATKNLTLVPGIKGLANWKKYCENKDFICINQFEDSLIKEHYKEYFSIIIKSLENYSIDAFCDCGHSCATMAGFIEANIVDWQFILGINAIPTRENVHHLTPYKDKYIQCFTKNFDTLKLGKEIEAAYPEFGNVYEATRSISAAMTWLKDNPGKTVLVYVGDSFEKEGTKFGQDK